MLCKAPNDNYSYTVDWSAELGGDTITAGTAYALTNQITTLAGDVYEKQIHIKVQTQLAS
jgi:hypothetical protein